MPQSGNQLDLMAPLLRRKNLLSKLASQLQKYQGQRANASPIGQAARSALSSPSGLRSVMGAPGMAARAVNPGRSSLPAQDLPQVDLSNIPSGFVAPPTPVAAPQGPDPATAPVGSGPGPDGGPPAASLAPAGEAPAASATAPSPYSNWQQQGFRSQQAMEEFYNLPEADQLRLLGNYTVRNRFIAVQEGT